MSLVQVISKNLTTAGTTQTTSAISTTAKNALVFCAAYKAVNAGVVTPSDSTGLTWNLVSSLSGGATGLTLAVWVANNITGNAANTFTFATTGADTPTIIIAESSGRDLNAPLDFFLTASDTIAASGAHTTGTINARGGDDLLAFNVSSAVSQTYASSGPWAIPPNGAITSALGYDAFVQVINSANSGANPNTYTVSVADKLDAFIIALKPPALPYSDEWLDAFVQDPEVYAYIASYQQFNLTPQIYDVDYDWLAEAGDGEFWTFVEANSAPASANVVINSVAQYYGEAAELWDETLDFVVFPGSYITKDSVPPLGPYNLVEPYDWFAEIDDDEWVFRDEVNVQNQNVVTVASQPPDVDWDDEEPDDFFADDFGNDDADLPQNDVWDHWSTDDDEYVITDDFFNQDNVGPIPAAADDGWDQEHFSTDDPDVQWTQDDYANPPNPSLNLEDPTWWDEEPDQVDGSTTDLDPVGTDNNPGVNVEDGFTQYHFLTEDDDYVVIDDYAIIDVVTIVVINVEDGFTQYHFLTDDADDYFVVDDYALINNTPVVAQPPDDPWDWTQAEDDYATPDDYAIIDVVASTQVPVDDAWDWANTDDADSYFVDDSYALINNTPATVEDSWDHFPVDIDDELYQVLDTDQVAVPQPAAIDDPWDFSQDADDEEWVFRDANAVEPLQTLNTPTDGWDHFSTDDDDYVTPDDYALITAVVAPSQFTDDTWDHFYESAEDNDMDFGVESSSLPANVYVFDPNFEVYMTQRSWVVMWLPTGIGTI